MKKTLPSSPLPPPRPYVDRWRRWSLRGNPFRRLEGADRVAGLVLDLPGVDSLDALVEGPQRVIQITGQSGWGKTTHLRSLRTHLEANRELSVDFAYLAEGQTRLRPLATTADVWMVDEAQRLSAAARKSLFGQVARSDRRLIYTSHEDLSIGVRGVGLSCRCIALQPADAKRLAAFVGRRLQIASITPNDEPLVGFSPGSIRAIHTFAAGSLARAEDLLYFLFQNVVQERPPARLTIDEALIEQAARTIPPVAGAQAST